MLNSKELLTELFQRLPYKIRVEFLTIDNCGESGGTFTDLRFLVKFAASAADSRYGHLLQREKGARRSQSKSGLAGSSVPKRNLNLCATQNLRKLPWPNQPPCSFYEAQHALWKYDKFSGIFV